MRNTEPTRAWTPPPGWPAPPAGWAPSLGWQPDPEWPAVPAGHQWWQPTRRGVRRRRTAIALVGLSSAAGLLYGIYRIAVLTVQDHALHQALRHGGSGWYRSPSIAFEVTLAAVWLCSIALLIPASSIGASELVGQGRRGRPRAAGFVALLCIGVAAQYSANLEAENSRGSPFAREAWLHDGRSWFALMCVLAVVVFAGAVTLLMSTADRTRVEPPTSTP